MSVYKDAKLWALDFDTKLARMTLSIYGAHRLLALEAKRDLVRLTSGTISEAELQRAGHPFGRTASGMMRGLVDPKKKRRLPVRRKYPINPINKQTGRLQREIFLRRVWTGTTGQAYDLGSDAPYEPFIFSPVGTELMVGRGIMTGHSLGKSAPGMIERFWRARSRVLRERYGIGT